MNEIIIYEPDNGGQVRVRLEGESLWLTQKKIADLFQRERSVITKHLRNIFQEGELAEESNVQFLHIANSDKPVKFYNLDAIISVGYRVNSKRGTQFRQWATGVLRSHKLRQSPPLLGFKLRHPIPICRWWVVHKMGNAFAVQTIQLSRAKLRF
jgi:hypothetical protein